MSSQPETGIVGMDRGTFLRLLAFFLAPAALIYSLFSIYPLLATIFNSLYLRQHDNSYIFVGTGNFTTLLTDWQFVGIPMILIYTALLAIPEELIDAATVDGLNQFQAFVWVKLPLILPTVGLVSILTFVNNFNAFDLIYAMKGALAGPNF